MTTTTTARRCCGSSVGGLITDAAGRLLMIERGWWPIGTAPVAGHVHDAHADPAAALRAEVAEEVGLEVTSHALIWQGRLPNLCASLPAEPEPGHDWWLYRATATGQLAPAEGETRGAAWYTPREVARAADATIAHARAERPAAELGHTALEAVWVELLHRAGTLQVSVDDRAAVEWLYITPPEHYWLGD